jgi:hypothetical protein
METFAVVLKSPKYLRAILFTVVLLNSSPAFGVILPPSLSVTLAWNSSPAEKLLGYRIYYGTARGKYSGSIDVGNVTTNKISGLVSNVTYFFTVTCYTKKGEESAFSNEISFPPPPPPTVQASVMANKQTLLILSGEIGHTYEIQATQDFRKWKTINLIRLGKNGTAIITDVEAARFPKRFYRLRDTQ